MKPVKLAATTLIPLIFLKGRHPHVEVPQFVPEPQPTNPFILLSTATATVLPLSAGGAPFGVWCFKGYGLSECA